MTTITITIPRINEPWEGQGGIYAGIGRNVDGQMYHLILGPSAPEALTHKAATEFAAAQNIDGHTDFTLPNRRDLSLLKATLGETFRTDDWYWSSEQRAGDQDCAWAQGFRDGFQGSWSKGVKYLGVAVRRVLI